MTPTTAESTRAHHARAGHTTNVAAPRAPVHWPELDGLRTIAVGLVVLTHAWEYPEGYTLLNRFIAAGWMGVDLFFVLSGFLITGILRRTRNAARYFLNFYARRTLRIVPAYLALLVLVMGVLPFFSSSPALDQVLESRWWYFLYLSNFILAAGGWQLFLLDITWSLAIEEQFYLIWPAIVRWVNRLVPICLALIVTLPLLRLVLWQVGVSWAWLHMMMPLRADAFALGALLALYQPKQKHVERLLIAAGTLLVLLIGSGAFGLGSRLVSTIGYTLTGLVAVTLVALARDRHRWVRWLGRRPMIQVGRVSYGIYLFHPLCLLVAGQILPAPLGLPGLVTRVLLVSVLAFTVASISFYAYEQPILRLKRRFE